MARRLLVTGGAGFIGANLVRYWARTHPEDQLVVLDKLTYAGNLHSIGDLVSSQAVQFVRGDIADDGLVAAVLRDHRVDTVIHLAAESHVDRSIHGPSTFIDTNVVGTHRLLMAVRQVWLEDGSIDAQGHFHHVSTDEVYGSLGPGDPPFTEATRYAPNSPYAASKAASDHLVRAYHETYDLSVTTSNCSNNYGPRQFPEKLIPLMLLNSLQGHPLPVYGDGQHSRDWLYVEDHCRGIESVLLHGRVGEVYNIGASCERTNLDVVRQLCGLIDEAFAQDPALAERFPKSPAAGGTPCAELIRFVEDRPGHDRRYAIDSSRAQVQLGFRPTETFESGLRRTLSWYLTNEAWWRSVQDGSYRQWLARQYGATFG